MLAVIGGSGLTRLSALDNKRRQMISTPYGEPSAPPVIGTISDVALVFLPRHGDDHSIPPHAVNYRANLWALHHLGARRVIAVNTVGGITDACRAPGTVVIPDQIIDYTWGRAHTYFDKPGQAPTHAEFSHPYCTSLRAQLIRAADGMDFPVVTQGTYAATQGPRFESIAEINRIERDGGDIVGMTGMPEAALARELDLCYAMLSVVVNPAAGKGDGEISLEEIQRYLKEGMAHALRVLMAVFPEVAADG
jgi:5'-methylthioinosine phosphorylase